MELYRGLCYNTSIIENISIFNWIWASKGFDGESAAGEASRMAMR